MTGNSGGILTIFQEGIGTFTVTVTSATIIRKGQTPISLGDILIGWRIHVKAQAVCSGNLTAVEVIVQNTNVETPTTTTPTAVANTNTPTPTAANTATPTPSCTAPASTATSTPTRTPTPAS